MTLGFFREMNAHIVPFQMTDEDIASYLLLQKSIASPVLSITTDANEARHDLADKSASFIYVDSLLAGFFAFQWRGDGSDRHLYLWELVLRKEYRRLGLGSSVLRLLRLENPTQIRLQVHPENDALQFYLKAGFVVKGWVENANHDGKPALAVTWVNHQFGS